MRRLRFASAAAAWLLCAASALAGEQASLMWLRSDRVETRPLSASAVPPQKVPLGSLWKLFVFAYLVDSGAQEPDYRCAAERIEKDDEERYCCAPGGSVARNAALAQSCALYFAPRRLHLLAADWRAYWQPISPAVWLRDPSELQPDTQVTVPELLQALAAIPINVRAEARSALLQTGVEGYGRDALAQLGTGIRFKTWSWHRADGSAFGGAAGWLADGTPFWFGANGSSRTALTRWAAQMAAALPQPVWRNTADTGCVDVDFFARYPIRAVWQGSAPIKVGVGELKGPVRIEFVNGNWLAVTAHGALMLNQSEVAPPTISGRLSINEYVARVVAREGSGAAPQAARALAIAARSYLMQNGHFAGGCWQIADASSTQRVAVSAPDDAALAAAWFTDQLILQGASIHYHKDSPGTNRLSWQSALQQDAAGRDFEQILSQAFPQASIATLSGREECSRIPAAELWLGQAASRWQSRLQQDDARGFEAPDRGLKICLLHDGLPYADQQRLRIYVRGWRTQDERVTLAHEYLHLALRFHPHGADEDYVERLARRLIQG